jgi:predicted transcriptional regulator YdeE
MFRWGRIEADQNTMKPEIIQLPALHLLGLSARFIRPMSPGANNTVVIPKLWARFCPLIPTLPQPQDKYVYGAGRSSSS